jgi:hypothetical protein
LKKQIAIIVLLLSVSILEINYACAQAIVKDPETRIQELGIKLRARGGTSSGSFKIGRAHV